MKKIALLFTYFFLSSMAVFSQNKTVVSTKAAASTALIAKEPYCATDQLHNKLLDQSSSYVEKFNKMNTNWQKWAMDPKSNASHKGAAGQSTQAYQSQTLPVVFHMMLNTTTAPIPGTSATDANLTKPQIQTALAKLNQLYAGTAVGSKAAGLNMDIQFCLAEVDNFGNAITSYTYSNPILPGTIGTLDNTNQAMITQLSNVVQATGKFPSNKYINIYVVEDITSPVAGFAYLPSAHGLSFDGIYIEAQYLLDPTLITATNDLANNMTVLTHEMGHYLGMFHTFGICNAPLIQACSCDNNNCLFNGDMVCDTPPDFSQGGLACGTFTNTCNTDATATIFDNLNLTSDVNDLTDNYMDYGNWNCQHNFTIGQRKRMHFMIDESIGPRNSLLNSNVCNTVCVNTTCTVSINPITTTSVSGINLPNAVILAGASVNYNFTANACTGVYNAFNWRAINLATNTVFANGTSSAGFNVNFTAIGNYRILLTSSMAGSVPLCFQTATLNMQVLPPANCPANLDMSTGWNVANWQRTQYDGGWARNTDNGTLFTFPTTTMTTIPFSDPNGTLNTDPFSIVSNLSADPNFSSVAMPVGVTNAMRVGRLITPTTVLPAGDASYVTYTFCPTAQNAKLQVYYLGMKEDDVLPIQGYANFAINASGGSASTFGYVCKYAFNSVYNGALSYKGSTQTGTCNYPFGKNDMLAGGLHSPSFVTVPLGTKIVDKMTSWESSILDFTDFICASPTITITFFARSDNASTLGFHHSYSYFAAKCLPGNFQDIDLNLVNKDIPCANNVTESCVTTFLPLPDSLSKAENYNQWFHYENMLQVDVQESLDNITYSTPIQGFNYNYIYPYVTPRLNLCKTPDSHPYKYFRITYKTLCQTIIDTVTIFQGFVHTINDCAPNPMSGGTYINPPVGIPAVSPDKYVQFCDSIKLDLTPPCWWQAGDPVPEYQWQYYTFDIPGATSSTYTVKTNYLGHCYPFRRMAKYNDPYCNVPIWVPSDYITASSFKVNNFTTNIIGPDVCGNSPATININSLFEWQSPFTCDQELIASYSITPAVNTMSIAFFSNSSCSPTSSISPISGPSVLTYTFNNSITSANPLSTSFTFFNNGIYSSTGTAYILITVTRLGCTATTTLQTTVKIKPSAIPGTITTNPCLLPIVSITGDNTNTTGYSWQYSYNSAFTTTLSLSGSTINSTSIPSSMFTGYPVYIRRVANGTTDCPNPAYSNTLTVINNSVNLSVSASTTICRGSSTTLTVSGALTYTWMPGAVTNSTTLVSPTATTIYTVTGTNATGCTAKANVTVTVVPTPTVNVTASSLTICAGSTTTLTASGATTYTWMPGGFNSNPLTASPTATTIYTVTGKTGNCTSIKTITITVIPTTTINVAASERVICKGASSTLTASGASTYTWAPISSTVNPITVSPIVTTVYTVTGSVGGGCSGTGTITITVAPIPTISIAASTSSICSGSSATFTASGASTYTWAPVSSTVNPITVNPTSTMVYTVTGQNSYGCISTSTVSLTVVDAPKFGLSFNTMTICSGSRVTLTASGTAPYTYTWTPFATVTTGSTVVTTPTATTVYTATASNGTPCLTIHTCTVYVTPTPTITITGNTVICPGATATLTASGGGTYLWSNGSAISTFTTNLAGVYSVTVSNGSCKAIKSVTVVVSALPVISVSASAYTICAGTSTTLTATGATTYTWLPSGSISNSIVVAPTVSTTYTVTGQNAAACVSTKTIVINVLPSPTVSISGNAIICSGSSTTLTATGGGTYLWSTANLKGSNNASVTVSMSGVNTVTVTGANGCITIASISTTVLALPVLTVTPTSTTICSGKTVTLSVSGASSYVWMPSGSATNPLVVTPLSTTVYTVTGENKYCASKKTVTVNVFTIPYSDNIW